MTEYNIIASTDESTVVAEYVPENGRADDYQSEEALEKDFIRRLVSQGYEYRPIADDEARSFCSGMRSCQ